MLRSPFGRRLVLGYADPPYPGKAHYYRREHDFGGEVDHAALVAELDRDFDGWALSTDRDSLRYVLGLCPPDVLVAPWVRGSRRAKVGRHGSKARNAWEPVIYRPARPTDDPPDDALVYVARPRTTESRRVMGQKPAPFLWWLFRLLGAASGDVFVDLFPGCGAAGRAAESVGLDVVTRGSCRRDASRLEELRVPELGTTRRGVLEDGTTRPPGLVDASAGDPLRVAEDLRDGTPQLALLGARRP